MARGAVIALLLCGAGGLWADSRTEKLTARLAEEAEAFQKLAPQVLGTETLHQSAPKPPRRFHIRIGAAAVNNVPEYQQRDIVSEYAFTTFAGDGALHELRQVTSVDGKPVKGSEDAAKRLADIITASDEDRKREMLERFEEYGLVGAATDFGQYILLFTPSNALQYEFAFVREDRFAGQPAEVFSYKQIDGPNPLTVVDAKRDDVRNLSIQGEIYVLASNYRPVYFTLEAVETLGDKGIRQHAEITYKMSEYGALLPAEVLHEDLRGSTVIARNTFRYTDFHRFGASSEIIFAPAPETEPQSGGTPPSGK